MAVFTQILHAFKHFATVTSVLKEREKTRTSDKDHKSRQKKRKTKNADQVVVERNVFGRFLAREKPNQTARFI
jgi:hypothetical protein